MRSLILTTLLLTSCVPTLSKFNDQDLANYFYEQCHLVPAQDMERAFCAAAKALKYCKENLAEQQREICIELMKVSKDEDVQEKR